MAAIEMTLPPGGLPHYTLTDDLAQYCLPAASRDENKRLAWADSICLLFLAIGLVGINPPKIHERVLPPPQDIVPVVYTPPPEEEKQQPKEIQEEEPEPADNTSLETPSVATVVAADASAVGFAVPVEGPVVFAPARFASAPPARPPKPVQAPKPVLYRRSAGDEASKPWPAYPLEEAKHDHRGIIKLMLSVVVNTNGFPAVVEVKNSAGHSCLDRFAQQWVKKHWNWSSGPTQLVDIEFTYDIK